MSLRNEAPGFPAVDGDRSALDGDMHSPFCQLLDLYSSGFQNAELAHNYISFFILHN